MPIQFQCPHCQHAMQLPDTAAGKQGKCPKCSNAVTVPVAKAAPSNPHDEEFWSELGDEKETVQEEEGTPQPIEKTDAQILRQMLGDEEEAKKIKRIGLPWQRPLDGGPFDRFWDTAIGVMNHPVETFGEMKLKGGIGGPLKYLIIGALLGFLILSVYATAGTVVSKLDLVGGGGESATEDGEEVAIAAGPVVTPAMGILFAVVFFATFLGGAIFGTVHAFLQAAGLQLALPMVGVKGSTFEKNFQISGYTSGSIFLCNIIPGLGAAFMLFVWFNGMIQGVASVYEVPPNKAAMAVTVIFVPLVLPLVVVGLGAAARGLGYI
jgi:hypothetical protein